MKPSSNGSCWHECDGCERDAPYDDQLVKSGWRRSDELDLDLCPACYDRLTDLEIMELSWAKLHAKCRDIGKMFTYQPRCPTCKRPGLHSDNCDDCARTAYS